MRRGQFSWFNTYYREQYFHLSENIRYKFYKVFSKNEFFYPNTEEKNYFRKRNQVSFVQISNRNKRSALELNSIRE